MSAVTLWRCPDCPLILVGPQIAGAEQHIETHRKGRFMNAIREELAAVMREIHRAENSQYRQDADMLLASPVIRRIQADTLRKFRAELIGRQFVDYGIVIPDVSAVVDELDEEATRIEKGEPNV